MPLRLNKLAGVIAGVVGSASPALLDLYPGAVTAYSTRKTRNDYSGPCMKVRHSVTNVEYDIGFVGGWLDELSLITVIGANTAFVTTWYDHSVLAIDATQSTAASQPMIMNAGVLYRTDTGKPSIYFQGGAWFRQLAGRGLTNAIGYFAGFAMYQRLSGNAGQHTLSAYATGTGSTVRWVLDSTTANDRIVVRRNDADTTNIESNPTLAGLHSIVGEARYFAGQTESFSNGSSNGQTAITSGAGLTSATNSFADPRIGGDLGGSNYLVGYMPELIEYNTDQTANRAAIIANQMAAFGVV